MNERSIEQRIASLRARLRFDLSLAKTLLAAVDKIQDECLLGVNAAEIDKELRFIGVDPEEIAARIYKLIESKLTEKRERDD
jgi:hypothetical protein